jgi:hypothetical protein
MTSLNTPHLFLILDPGLPNLTTLLFSFARFLVAVGEK